MILGFKKQFVSKILEGSKYHTIREDKHDRWKVGNKIHFATGVRTKDYKQFAEGVCGAISTIEICYKRGAQLSKVYVSVNDKWIGEAVWWDCQLKFVSHAVEVLAKNDGFDNANDFFEWFNEDFKGKIIYWELNDKRI